MDGGQGCTCYLPYTDMKVVKVPSSAGAGFGYELRCPACRGSGADSPFTTTSFVSRLVLCIAAILAILLVHREVVHGFSVTLGVVDFLSRLSS
jgi:hypothetical protein